MTAFSSMKLRNATASLTLNHLKNMFVRHISLAGPAATAQSTISIDHLKNMLIKHASLIGPTLTARSTTFIDTGLRIRDVVTDFCKLIRKAVTWAIHLPRSVWTALTSAFNSVTRSIAHALALAVHTVKTGLWYTFVLFAVVTAIAIAVRVFPYLVRAFERVMAAQRVKQEEARAQQLLKEQRKSAEEQIQRQNEARRKTAHEEQQALLQAQARKHKEDQRFRQCLINWEAASERVLADKTILRRFPEPEMDPCINCQNESRKPEDLFSLRICIHNLEKLLRSSGRYGELLRDGRLKWHPDRFGSTSAPVKDVMVRKATNLFQMFDALFEKESGPHQRL